MGQGATQLPAYVRIARDLHASDNLRTVQEDHEQLMVAYELHTSRRIVTFSLPFIFFGFRSLAI
jgi:hypothetical protein